MLLPLSDVLIIIYLYLSLKRGNAHSFHSIQIISEFPNLQWGQFISCFIYVIFKNATCRWWCISCFWFACMNFIWVVWYRYRHLIFLANSSKSVNTSALVPFTKDIGMNFKPLDNNRYSLSDSCLCERLITCFF